MYENNIEDIKKAQIGDEIAFENLVNNNKGLIWNIVKRFTGRGYETDDLYQIGCLGFIKAIKKFDTSFEVQLSTYAVPYILGEIKRFLRDDGIVRVSRSIKELGIKIRQLQNQYDYDIDINTIAKKLKITKEEVAIAMDAITPVQSIYQEEAGTEGRLLIDKISTKKDEETMITNKIAIKQLIQGLEKREQEIILLRFFKDKTQSQVGKILGISQVQVSRIEKRVLSKMKKDLEAVWEKFYCIFYL